MFEIEKVSSTSYRLWEDEEHIGCFEYYDPTWHYDMVDVIIQDTNPNIFPFILKTLENLNNGVVYE